jgi:anthraniloyl-CoA monooxygenase
MTEMVCVSAQGRISPADTGLWDDAQEEAWKGIVGFVHSGDTGPDRPPARPLRSERLDQEDVGGRHRPLEEGNWEIISPSPIPYRSDSQTPREMTRRDMDEVRDQFVASAERGARAGFDLLELHYAHGYLMSSFLTPLANQRTDEYGGSLENRMRFPLEVLDAVRGVWPADRPISVRISATDWVPGGFDGDDAVELARALRDHGCDIVDVSTGQTSVDARPEYGRLYQTPFSDRIRHEVGTPTMTVGAVSSIDDVHNILVAGRADLCLLARPHLVDPYWTLNAAIDLGYTGHDFPSQYLSGLGRVVGNRTRSPRTSSAVEDPLAPELCPPERQRGGRVPATERSDVGGRGQLLTRAKGPP